MERLLTNKTDIMDFINYNKVFDYLNTRKNLILDNGIDIKLSIKSDNFNFIDENNMYINVKEYEDFVPSTEKVILLSLEGIVIEKCHLLLNVDGKENINIINECSKFLQKKYKYPENFTMYISSMILNVLQSIKVQNIAIKHNKYNEKRILIRNILIAKYTKLLNDNLYDLFNILKIVGTTSYVSKDFLKKYKEEFLLELKVLVRNVVNGTDKQLYSNVIKLLEYLDEILKNLNPDDYKEKNKEINLTSDNKKMQDNNEDNNENNNENNNEDKKQEDDSGLKAPQLDLRGLSNSSANNSGSGLKFDTGDSSGEISSEDTKSNEEIKEMSDSELENKINEINEEVTKEGNDFLKEVLKNKNDKKSKKPSVSDDKKTLNDMEMEEILEDISEIKGGMFSCFEINEMNLEYTDLDEVPPDIQGDIESVKERFKEIFEERRSIYRNRKKGQVDTNLIWKYKFKDESLFFKNNNPNTDFVIYILIDDSGSMSFGDKYKSAWESAAVIEECLREYLPLQISAFSDSGYINHKIIKKFDDILEGNYCITHYKKNQPSNCNSDGLSLRVVEKELLKRDEEKKVLFIISDGQPAGSNGYIHKVAFDDVKKVVKRMRNNGIKVFNLFINDSNRTCEIDDEMEIFKYMYEYNILNCTGENLTDELVQLVENEINA